MRYSAVASGVGAVRVPSVTDGLHLLDDRGLLQPGRRADFVVLAADPLADIRNLRTIEAVWQAGRRVAGPVAEYRTP